MGRHGENIRKRKDGRWEARYPVTMSPDHKKIYRSVYGKTYREVKEKRADILAGRRDVLPGGDEKTVDDVLAFWLAQKKLEVKEQTWLKYSFYIQRHISPDLGCLPASKVDAAVISRFLDEKLTRGKLDHSGGLSRSSVRTLAILLSAAFLAAYNEKQIPFPLGKITKPVPERRQVVTLRLAEQQTLEKFLCRDLCGSALAVYLCLHIGLRLGEVCALRWSDVDLQQSVIHINHTVIRLDTGVRTSYELGIPKTNRSLRTIPLTDALCDLLHEVKKGQTSEFVISAAGDTAFPNPRTLEYRFCRMLKACGLSPIPFHALRHTFATRWIECGMDIKSLSEILGHANVNTTLSIYVHSSDQLKREGLCRMETICGQ